VWIASLLDVLEAEHLPFGWRSVTDREPVALVSIQYKLFTDASSEAPPTWRLHAGPNPVAEVRSVAEAGRALTAHAELFIAEHAPDHLFVHAGAVGWKGHAIVMPGASFAGKTTLVQAWLEAGATYYSDEFAVLDRAGRIHPYARPLSVRDESTGATRRVPIESLGATSGTTPLPVGLVLVTSYRAGARWRPRPLTPAPALLALMGHTVAARGNPAHSMPILKRAVSGSIARVGVRGEARALVSSLSGMI